MDSQQPALGSSRPDVNGCARVSGAQGSADSEDFLWWSVVANVVPGVDENGTKHFTAGTKVWVLPVQWGDGGEMLIVAGRHRGQPGGLTRMVLARRALHNFRVKPIYNRSVVEVLEAPFPGRNGRSPFGSGRPRLWESREAAEEGVRWLTQEARRERGYAVPRDWAG